MDAERAVAATAARPRPVRCRTPCPRRLPAPGSGPGLAL